MVGRGVVRRVRESRREGRRGEGGGHLEGEGGERKGVILNRDHDFVIVGRTNVRMITYFILLRIKGG